ncbi:MAG: hypothetical protein U5K76_12305 [Woeseiaceae bacterium]|nr:hypothetical protein [Woeseiaceae bacterium]
MFLTPLDVSDDRDFRAFPGGFEAENAAGDPGFMLSYGTVDFRFEQDGELLSLAAGQTATIDIPIYVPNDADGTPLTEGAAIPRGHWMDHQSLDGGGPGHSGGLGVIADRTRASRRGDPLQLVELRRFPGAERYRRHGRLFRTGTSRTAEVDIPDSNLVCRSGGDGGPRYSGTIALGPGGTLPLLPVPGNTDLDRNAVGFGGLAATTDPDPVNAGVGAVLPVDLLLRPRHEDDDPFIPGQLLHGEMTNVGEPIPGDSTASSARSSA